MSVSLVGYCLRLAGVALVVSLGSCGPAAAQSTVLTAGDLTDMTTQMSASLRSSDFFRERTTQSEKAIIVTDKIENMTSDIIPEPEEWMLMARVQGSMPLNDLANEKNVRFEIPPERALMIKDAGYSGRVLAGSHATHLLNAVFRSSTRVHSSDGIADNRLDYYMLEYILTDLRTSQMVWSHVYEFKRTAVGNPID